MFASLWHAMTAQPILCRHTRYICESIHPPARATQAHPPLPVNPPLAAALTARIQDAGTEARTVVFVRTHTLSLSNDKPPVDWACCFQWMGYELRCDAGRKCQERFWQRHTVHGGGGGAVHACLPARSGGRGGCGGVCVRAGMWEERCMHRGKGRGRGARRFWHSAACPACHQI
jgi:hypothetical protein